MVTPLKLLIGTPLQLLIIEDSERDVALEVRALEAAGYRVTYTVAINAAEMKSALADKAFDLVITDHDLPQFDAPRAMAVLKQSGRDIPLIIVSGTIGEETAVALIKAGAHDYILKDRLSRMTSAVEKALQDAEDRRVLKEAEKELRESEEQFRTLLENAPDGVYLSDLKGNFLYGNRKCEEIIGYKREELIGKNMLEVNLLAENSFTLAAELLQDSADGKSTGPTEFVLIRKDGRSIPVEINTAILQRKGHAVVIAFIRDITERKKAEDSLRESEERFKNMASLLPQVIFEADEKGNFTFVNRQGLEIFGYTEAEAAGMNIFETIIPQDRSKVMENIGGLIKGQNSPSNEYTALRKAGSKFPVRIYASPIMLNSRYVGMRGILVDITESKQAEDALRESEQKYRSLVTQSPDGIFVVNLKGTFLAVNRGMCETLKYREEELLSMNIWDIVPEQFRDVHKKRMADILMGKTPNEAAEYLVKGKDGNVHYVEILSAPYYEGKELIGFQGIARDITERKKAEDTLKESEAKYRAVIEAAADQIFVIDSEMKILSVNSFAASFFHKKPEDMVGKSLFEIFPEQVAARTSANIRKVFETGTNTIVEEVLTFGDKNIWNSTSLSPMKDLNGKVIAVMGIVRDITEGKEAAEALRESELLYRRLIETSPDAIGLMDINGTIIMHNKQALEVFGFESTEDLRGKNIMDMVAPENYKEILENVEKLQKAEVIRNWEVTSYKKDGRPFSLELSSSTLFDEAGKPKSIMAVFKDISERKLSEEKLAKSYEALKKTLNDAINTMAKIVEMRDPYTSGHQQRVAELATAIAREMGCGDDQIEQLRMAAVIHDIGKIYVPSDILSKPGKISKDEFNLIKTHAQGGYDIVKGMDFPCAIAQSILQHHERLDGSGYPNGLKGQEICLEAKILSVSDVVEAMSSHRPYRAKLGMDKALEEISENKGRLYDSDVVDACLKLFNSGKFEFKPLIRT